MQIASSLHTHSVYSAPLCSKQAMAVDVDRRRRMAAAATATATATASLRLGQKQTQAQVAALKRLYARANNAKIQALHPPPAAAAAAAALLLSSSSSSSPSCVGGCGIRKGLASFQSLARGVADRLRHCGVRLEKGLSEEEVARIEAELCFSFPPDLKALLQECVPAGDGFPDWRCPRRRSIIMNNPPPVEGLCSEAAAGKFWLRQWGPRPSHGVDAAAVARQALRKVPLLIPLYLHFYVPSSPVLAGNPVFWVYQSEVVCCGVDISDFFHREAFGSDAPGVRRRVTVDDEDNSLRKWSDVSSRDLNLDRKSFDGVNFRKSACLSCNQKADLEPRQRCVMGAPRWIDFWTGLAEKKFSSSVSPSHSAFAFESEVMEMEDKNRDEEPKAPNWLSSYMDDLASLLRNGGWKEEDITDMIVRRHQSGGDGDGDRAVDTRALFTGMLLKADSMSESLRRAGWTSQDLSELFNFDIQFRTSPMEITAAFDQNIGKLLMT